jgi:RNA polymerase sigma factor (sigma-70 family)
MSAPISGPRMLRGDEAQLFAQHELPLRCAVRRAINASDAVVDDACSFAWLQLLRRQPDRHAVFAWLRTVAIREAWRLAARERRDAPLDDLPPSREPRATSVERAHDARAALTTLAALPHRQRSYLTLVVSGCSYDEIARHHGTTQTNVNRHLAAARRHLRAVDTSA